MSLDAKPWLLVAVGLTALGCQDLEAAFGDITEELRGDESTKVEWGPFAG